MVVAASKKDETVTTPLKKIPFPQLSPTSIPPLPLRNYLPPLRKNGTTPPKSFNTLHGTQCMHIWKKKVQFDKNSCFLYGYSKGSQRKIRAYTDLSVILIFPRVFLNCHFFPIFWPNVGAPSGGGS